MQLIADSGSTKTDWVIIDQNSVIGQFNTIGFNPYFQTTEQIYDELILNLKPFIVNDLSKIDRIFYYGAGCSNDQNINIVKVGLELALEIKQIEVQHDLLAAARALCGKKPGIACILGTGSNSSLYDGNSIIENVPSVGYLFGDDGSGAHIGRTFIQAYFDGILPDKLKLAFENAGFHREIILNNVYKNTMPSKYLASINSFITQNLKNIFIQKIIKDCFEQFFDKQVGKYTNSRKYSVNSVGSIGFYYKDILAEVANLKGYKIGKIIQSPIEGLIEFHMNHV